MELSNDQINIVRNLLTSNPSKSIYIGSDDYQERYKQLEFLTSFEKKLLHE